MLEAGDVDGQVVWKRILAEVDRSMGHSVPSFVLEPAVEFLFQFRKTAGQRHALSAERFQDLVQPEECFAHVARLAFELLHLIRNFGVQIVHGHGGMPFRDRRGIESSTTPRGRS